MRPSFAFTGLAALLSLGCSDRIPLGGEPSLWMADHEGGDLLQWKEGAGGDTFVSRDGTLSLVSHPVHGGRYAVKSSISNVSIPSLARLYRQDNLPEAAYYSVWLYLPEAYAVGEYWNVFEFTGGRSPDAAIPPVALWSLDLRQDADQRLAWYVYDGIGRRELTPIEPLTAPIGRWFRVTAFLRQASDQTGRLSFWIDDRLFIDETGLATVPGRLSTWSVGSVADRMPAPADLFLDDAMISIQPPGG